MDFKVLLKEARDAIKNGDYKTALRISKSVIKEDRRNYMAMVLLGISFQEVGPADNAEKAFRKAIDINRSNPLAWQYLIKYHEKLNTNKSELVELYLGYLGIETNEAKLVEYSKKLLDLNELEDLQNISKVLLEVPKKLGPEHKTAFFKSVVGFLEKNPDTNKPLDLYEECFNEMSSTSSISETFYLSYLTELNKAGNISKVLDQAKKVHQLFPSNLVALSWICKIFNQMYIEEGPDLDVETMSFYVDKLLNLDPNNAMGQFSKALLLYRDNKVSMAKEILAEVTMQRPGLIYAWILFTDVLIKLHLAQEALESLNKSRKLMVSLNSPTVVLDKVRCQEIEILSLSQRVEDLKKCLEISNKEGFNRTKCLPALISVCLSLGYFTEAEKYLSELKSSNKDLWQLYLLRLYRKQGKISEAKKLVEDSTLNYSEWWIEVGLIYWESTDFNKSLEPFLNAAKCDPDNYTCFVHLGHYYNKINQLEKARRCYEKAFKLNSVCSEAGSELSKIYRKQKNWDANLKLLISLTRDGFVNNTNIWAWFQLGLTYLEQGNPTKAIEYLRMATRMEQNNLHYWECLADAYFSKGAFNSALKCYQKALDLETTLYSTLQMACIKKILGEYEEARVDFENILVDNNKYVPALKGLAETYLSQAKECFKDQRLGTARDLAQSSINKVALAILQRSELTCLWKLLADNLHFVAKLPEKFSFLKVPKVFVEHDDNADTSSVILEESQLFDLAVKCYRKSVSLDQDNSYLWHDLAVCYIQYACHISNPEKKRLLSDYAQSAAQHCTKLNPHYWQHWNLLGAIAILKSEPNYALAQHCFIKAVIAESNSAIAWTNLGTLYLSLGDLKLANKAFGEGQRSDPNYVNSWIGQATIAETMGHSDAMDLFRHSTQLGQHQQGSIGYGHWVCDMLLNRPEQDKVVEYSIYKMHAIPVAYDCINWYLEKNPDSGCAWNIAGILAERLRLLDSAKRAFKHALILAGEKCKDIARINYGRLLYRTGEYEGAIDMFSNVSEATFSSGAGLALALFRNEQYEESYTAYEQALHWLTEEQTSQSELLVALASMAYKFQGPDGAKTLLFQSIGLNPPSPWSLYATFSLALLHNDFKLAKLVYKELVNLEMRLTKGQNDYSEFIHHYATLLSRMYLLKNDKKEAVTGLSRLVHKYPNIASTWLILSQLILKMENDKSKLQAGANCANNALKLGKIYTNPSKVLCLAALSFQRAEDSKQAFIFAQKAIHYSPNVSDGWAVLLPLLKQTKNLNFSSNLQNYFLSIKCNIDITT